MAPKISTLASHFQKFFLKDTYSETEEITQAQQILFEGEISYFEFNKNESIENLINTVTKNITETKNSVILSYGEKILQKLDFEIRKRKKKTLTTFISQEFLAETEKFEEKQKEAKRSAKKSALQSEFSLEREGIKLSTTHSFKGYEADTVVLIIQSWEDNDELIYTALTRAKEKLVILNIENSRYEEFFQKNSKLLKEKPFKFTVYEIQEENFQLKEKLSEKERNERFFSQSIQNLEEKNTQLQQEKNLYKERITTLEDEISSLEKEITEKNKITKIFKKDSEEVKKLQEKIEKLRKEKQVLKKDFSKKEKEIENLKGEFDKKLEEEKKFFEQELEKEKQEISERFEEEKKLMEKEYQENLKQFTPEFRGNTIKDNTEKNIQVLLFGKSNLNENKIKGIFKELNKKYKDIILSAKIISLNYDEMKHNPNKSNTLLNKVKTLNKGEYIVIIGSHPHSLIGIEKKSSNSFIPILEKFGEQFIFVLRKNNISNELASINQNNLKEKIKEGIEKIKQFNK